MPWGGDAPNGPIPSGAGPKTSPYSPLKISSPGARGSRSHRAIWKESKWWCWRRNCWKHMANCWRNSKITTCSRNKWGKCTKMFKPCRRRTSNSWTKWPSIREKLTMKRNRISSSKREKTGSNLSRTSTSKKVRGTSSWRRISKIWEPKCSRQSQLRMMLNRIISRWRYKSKRPIKPGIN